MATLHWLGPIDDDESVSSTILLSGLIPTEVAGLRRAFGSHELSLGLRAADFLIYSEHTGHTVKSL